MKWLNFGLVSLLGIGLSLAVVFEDSLGRPFKLQAVDGALLALAILVLSLIISIIGLFFYKHKINFVMSIIAFAMIITFFIIILYHGGPKLIYDI